MNSDEILTVAEVAAELRCSKAHVYNAIAGRVNGVNALPAISMGRSSLEMWKRENETDMLTATSEIDAVGA